jgi:hypothetical protein
MPSSDSAPSSFDPGPQVLARCQFRRSLFFATATLRSPPADVIVFSYLA